MNLTQSSWDGWSAMLYMHGICSVLHVLFLGKYVLIHYSLSSFDIHFLEKSGFHFPPKELVFILINELCNVLTEFSYYPNLHEQTYPLKFS
jgi:hypothetical protein